MIAGCKVEFLKQGQAFRLAKRRIRKAFIAWLRQDRYGRGPPGANTRVRQYRKHIRGLA